jgi:hypothetical protein
MPETPMPNDADTYAGAVRALADALANVWQACEAGYDHRRGLGTVGNLAEALGALVCDDEARLVAAEALVSHRPGCWEADHVRALTFPPELIEHTERP